MQGKKAPSHNPIKNRKAYSCGTDVTAEHENVKIDHNTSSVGTRIEGRMLVTNMTAGN